jgi:hypothetical protein
VGLKAVRSTHDLPKFVLGVLSPPYVSASGASVKLCVPGVTGTYSADSVVLSPGVLNEWLCAWPSDQPAKRYVTPLTVWLAGALRSVVLPMIMFRENGAVSTLSPTTKSIPAGSDSRLTGTVRGSSRSDVVSELPSESVAVSTSSR